MGRFRGVGLVLVGLSLNTHPHKTRVGHPHPRSKLPPTPTRQPETIPSWNEKGRSGERPGFKISETIWVAARSGWLGWLVGALLLDFFDLVDQVVGLLQQVGALVGSFDEVGLAAIEKVEIGHRVIVVGA